MQKLADYLGVAVEDLLEDKQQIPPVSGHYKLPEKGGIPMRLEEGMPHARGVIAFDEGANAPPPTQTAQALLRVISELTLIASEALSAQLSPVRQARLRELSTDLNEMIDRLAPTPGQAPATQPTPRTGARRR